MLVRRRGPRRIPGPRRPHPCGKDIMTFSLADFMGYAMTVISAVEHLNIDSDFDKWQVSLACSGNTEKKPPGDGHPSGAYFVLTRITYFLGYL